MTPTFGTAVIALVLLTLIGDCHNRVIYNQHEIDALQALLRAWDHHPSGWSTTQVDPCSSNGAGSWEGVYCLQTPVGGNSSDFKSLVVGLELLPGMVHGTLPPEIGNLTNLVILSLSGHLGNILSGSLPKELGRLTNLETLNLSHNNFSGSIPAELANLSGLQELGLSSNLLTGQLPNVGGMNSLRVMNVSRNHLSGPLTSNYGFQNLTKLATMDLSRNAFTGLPPDITSLDSLQYLYLGSNQFTGFVKPASSRPLNLFVDLSNNTFTGPLPDLSDSFANFSLYLDFNKFDQGKAPDWLWRSSTLSTISLRSCGLSGTFPYEAIQNLPMLYNLMLDNNNIGGDLNITRINDSISHKEGLTISIKDNNITTIYYTSRDIKDASGGTDSSYGPIFLMLEGNPYCSTASNDGTRCYCNHMCFNLDGTTNANVQKVIIISTISSGTVLGLVIFIAVFLFWRSRRERRYLLLRLEEKFAEFEVKPTIFSYAELRNATRDFDHSTKLGQGSYGAVFKGKLSNGMEVAVKQLFAKNQQGIDDFLNEVVLITGVKHRNLVKLKGCCLRESRRLLVYEYIENHNLAEILFEGRGGHILTWPMRLNICLGVARGLQYLHEIAEPRIIHRDIKANNILLDKNFQAKIADFGLALLFPDDDTHIYTKHVAGTRGYLAPEYATLGQLTEKVDVFSFGVLMLEIISGRKNMDSNLPHTSMYLPNQAWRLHSESKLTDVVDPSLHLHGDEEVAIQQAINVALSCLLSDAERRPTMGRVVAFLQGEAHLQVVEKDIGIGNLNKSYDFLYGAGSGFGVGTVVSESSLPLFPGPSSMVVTSNSNPTIQLTNIESSSMGSDRQRQMQL